MSSKRKSGCGLSRREFVSGAAALAAAALPAACRPARPAAGAGKTLKILQWSHFVPGYDRWFDGVFTKEWGARNGTEVIVDHMTATEVAARGAAEAAAGKGHDLFLFQAPPAAYESRVLDHRDVVEAVEKKHGKMLPLALRSTFNPKTGKFFAFADSYVADPGNYRIDLWGEEGLPDGPRSWDELRVVGARIKAKRGIPVGIGLAQETDSNMALRALLWSFGGAEQDEQGNLTLNSRETLEALRFARALYRETMTPEVFTWDPSSNNRMMLAGRGSFILNAISVTRTAEKENPDIARKIGLAPAIAGPVRRLTCEHVMNCYVIWKFAENPEGARQFLVDLADNLPSVFRRSEFYNLPCYPQTVPDLPEELARDPKADPPGKYRILATAVDWSANVGYPGYATAATDEIFNTFLIPTLFARVARDEASPEEALRVAEDAARRIFERRRSA
jgi:multiple sugar transport system substrate-binding protein